MPGKTQNSVASMTFSSENLKMYFLSYCEDKVHRKLG